MSTDIVERLRHLVANVNGAAIMEEAANEIESAARRIYERDMMSAYATHSDWGRIWAEPEMRREYTGLTPLTKPPGNAQPKGK